MPDADPAPDPRPDVPGPSAAAPHDADDHGRPDGPDSHEQHEGGAGGRLHGEGQGDGTPLGELGVIGMQQVEVAPGLVHTPMIHKHVNQLTPETWAKIEACHPLGMGRPDDVAAAVAFLASADARWITGITLPLGWAYHYPLPTGQMMG